MSEKDNESSEISVAADVPESGGGTAAAFGDSTLPQQPLPADVPEGGGGTGG